MSHITSNCLLASVGIMVYICVNSKESMELHSLKISMTDQNCNWMFLFLISKLIIRSHFFCSSISAIHILMNLLYCKLSQGVGKQSRVKRKLINADGGGKRKFILCVFMYVKLSVFSLKMKVKEFFFCYVVRRSLSGFKYLFSKRL